jgi:GH25 family lysozyme M1 (1,4-beta-N-acetylmuramidase)
MTLILNGIDVSAAGQGTAFNWAPYRGKVSFAFTKISEALGYADPSAARNIAQMRADGITPGGYHFLHASLSGAAQAEYFLSRAAAAGLGKGCLLAIDAEDFGLDLTDAQRNDPTAVAAAMARMNEEAAAFRAQLQKHFPGFNPEAYTEISMAPSLTSLGSCPLWLANPDGVHTGPLGPWAAPSFEQTGQRGVDTDVFYGDVTQLAKLTVPH